MVSILYVSDLRIYDLSHTLNKGNLRPNTKAAISEANVWNYLGNETKNQQKSEHRALDLQMNIICIYIYNMCVYLIVKVYIFAS